MKRKARSKVERKKIVEYWKGKIEINTTWDNALSHCWACGSDAYNKLERSHIIPHCLNGIGHPCNLILLCTFCNCQCPETIFGNDFMLWLKSRVNKEKYYYLDPENPLSISKEYENIYGREMFNNPLVGIFSYYFEQKRYLYSFNRYRTKVEGGKMFSRYPATTAVMFNKYNNILMDALDYILKNRMREDDKEKLAEVFYNFLEIEPEVFDDEELHVGSNNEEVCSLPPLPPLPPLSIFKKINTFKEEDEDITYGPKNMDEM